MNVNTSGVAKGVVLLDNAVAGTYAVTATYNNYPYNTISQSAANLSVFTGEFVGGNVAPGGTLTTDVSNTGATPTNTVQTLVMTPSGGVVTIAEEDATPPPSNGYTFLAKTVVIAADPATVASPLVIVFSIDASIVPAGVTAATLQVFRNGLLVPACTGAPQAIPDPCVSLREPLGDGDIRITVRTSVASKWTLGYALNAQPTVVVALGGTCASDGSPRGTLNLSLADIDSPVGGLTLTAVSSNQALLPNGGITFSGSGASRTVTLAAAPKKSGTAVVTITVSDGQASSTLTLTLVVGTDRNETISGSAGTDVVFGLGGANTINGNADSDLLCGGNGNDTISGGDGADTIDGENGNDFLSGGAGTDMLRGGSGNDTLTGGPDGDAFSGGPGTDTITDFSPAQGDSKDATIP